MVFTEPLEIDVFTTEQKLQILPFYGLAGALCYMLILPYQYWAYQKNKNHWFLKNEIIALGLFVLLAFCFTHLVYYFLVAYDDPSSYNALTFLLKISLPGVVAIMPIVLVGRWATGKYQEKRLEDQKIEIKGQGNYENLRLAATDLVYVQSADNYVEINYLENGNLQTKVMRSKLTTIERDISELTRSHRSFLFNPYHFKEWKKESNKVTVVLHGNIEVPVSKTFATEVKQAIDLTTKAP